MNTLDTLKALVAQLEAEQPTTPKPRCDAQGRLLSAPDMQTSLFHAAGGEVLNVTWTGHIYDSGALSQGQIFISKAAAEAELTRLKCLQRLRGMDGYNPYGGEVIVIGGCYILDGFDTEEALHIAAATITPEERAAFLYREPMGEK